MKTQSAKGKGRRLQQQVASDLIKKINKVGLMKNEPELTDKDVKSLGMGQSGRDIELSTYAEKKIPFDIECKNTEKASPWQWIKQAETNTEQFRIPLVVFKRNRSKTYAIIKWEDLLELIV